MRRESVDAGLLAENLTNGSWGDISRRMSGARGLGGGAPARANEDRTAPAQPARRRRLVVIGGAILMALAGGAAGAHMALDGIDYPALRGPRLRVSSVHAEPVEPSRRTQP